MNHVQTIAVMMAAVMVLTVTAPAVVAQSNTTLPSEEPEPTMENTSDTNVTVGQRLSGVIAMERAEINGEIDRSQFEARVSNAENSSEQAQAVADELEATNQTVAEIREERAELREAFKNGNVSRVEYTTRMAEYSVELKNAKRSAERSGEVTEGLPEDVLRENGVDVSKIQTLKDSASELSGQEVAEIARQIAGNGPDNAADRDNPGNNSKAPGDRGPPADRGNADGNKDVEEDDEDEGGDEKHGSGGENSTQATSE